jgi:hypothetical protein
MTLYDTIGNYMTVDRFLQTGEAETIKGGVHAAVGVLALVCGVYNAAAWVRRGERHLGVNAVFYAGLAIWEACHVRHHGRQGLRAR